MKERKEVPETTRMRHVANRIVRARHRIPTEPMSRGVLYQCCMWLLKPFFWLISPRLDVHKKNDDQFSSIDDPFAAAAAFAPARSPRACPWPVRHPVKRLELGHHGRHDHGHPRSRS